MIEAGYHVSGVLQERQSNQRRRMSTGFQLHRMGYQHQALGCWERLTDNAKAIYVAFKRHHMDTSMYPYASQDPAFQLDSFEPLVSMGYYDGRLLPRLRGETADGYDSPDDNGVNQEFWLEVTLGYDNTIRFLISDSDDAPLAGGDYMDGIFLYRNGVLTRL